MSVGKKCPTVRSVQEFFQDAPFIFYKKYSMRCKQTVGITNTGNSSTFLTITDALYFSINPSIIFVYCENKSKDLHKKLFIKISSYIVLVFIFLCKILIRCKVDELFPWRMSKRSASSAGGTKLLTSGPSPARVSMRSSAIAVRTVNRLLAAAKNVSHAANRAPTETKGKSCPKKMSEKDAFKCSPKIMEAARKDTLLTR